MQKHIYNHFVICDVCGRKVRRTEVTRITDSFNFLYGLVVCKRDLDKTNPQNYPDFPWKESIVDPKYVRPEIPPSYIIAQTASDIEQGTSEIVGGILPSEPRYLYTIEVDTLVKFGWISPLLCGSRAPIGFAIQRNINSGAYTTLTTNTNSIELTYIDTTVSANTQYHYKVAMVTYAGTGPYSNPIGIHT